MAKLGVISTVTVFFKDVPIKFKIEAVAEGKIDKETKKVAGIDAIEFRKDLDKIIRNMEYKGIGKSLREEGIEFYGMESIAMFIIKKLKQNYPISYVRVWEGQDEYAIVSSDEV
ncbi:MAG: hypothetical protein J7K73_04005 [Nanoarchaeota archaeon]|nr:hypothetical protein [Nanoarchaeota archaeon]